MDRITKENVEARVNGLNARFLRYRSHYRVYVQSGNGMTNLYETSTRDKTYMNHIVSGTKKEIAEYLSAMARGIDLVKG